MASSAPGRERIEDLLSGELLEKKVTALLESLPAAARARLRWTPRTLEELVSRLVEEPIDEALLLDLHNGARRVIREFIQGIREAGPLAILQSLLGVMGQLSTVVPWASLKEDVAQPELPGEPPSKRLVLRKIDVLSEHDYRWSMATLDALVSGCITYVARHRDLFFKRALPMLSEELEGPDPFGEELEGLEAAASFKDLSSWSRGWTFLGVSAACTYALDVAERQRKDSRTFIKLSRAVTWCLASLGETLDEARQRAASELEEARSEGEDEDLLTIAQDRHDMLESLVMSLSPLMAARPLLIEAGALIRAFKQHEAQALLEGADRARDPSGVLESLYQRLRSDAPMMVYRPRHRPLSASAFKEAMSSWTSSPARARWAAFSEEGLVDQDDSLELLKSRLGARASDCTVISLGEVEAMDAL